MRVLSVTGEFTDGRTAALRTVSVSYDGQFLILRDEAGRDVTRWDTRRVRVAAERPPDGFQLECLAEPEACLEIRGDSLVDDLREMGILYRGLPQQLSKRMFLAIGLVAGIAGLVGLIWAMVTPLSRALAQLVPLEVERKLAGQMELALASRRCESDQARIVIDALVLRIAGPDHGLPPVHIINLDPVNAFAFPGGSIVLTRGLLEAAERPAEIAGILAHEIQHVRQRHIMTAMIRGTLLTSIWSVTLGDYSGLLVIDPTTAFQIATLQFSREAEASADRGALEMLDAAGIPRDGLESFFDRLTREEGSLPVWLSTHPASARRAEAVQSASSEPIDSVEPVLDDAQWSILVGACRGAGPPGRILEEMIPIHRAEHGSLAAPN